MDEPHVMLGVSVMGAETDELVITTMTHGPAARLRSQRLVAGAAGLTPARGDGPLLEDRAVG